MGYFPERWRRVSFRRMSGLSHAVRTVRAIRAAILRPPYVTPGHSYSPLTSSEDTRRAQLWKPEAPGVDLNGDA